MECVLLIGGIPVKPAAKKQSYSLSGISACTLPSSVADTASSSFGALAGGDGEDASRAELISFAL